MTRAIRWSDSDRYFGAQTGDSRTDKSKVWFVPWRNWRHIRRSFYDLSGKHDGEQLTATTKIEEREWRLGTRWFKWLSLFRRAKIQRSLDIRFSGETGKRKGSWKGGTVGHSIGMGII